MSKLLIPCHAKVLHLQFMTCTFIQKKIQVNTSNHTKIPPFPPLPSFHTVSQKKAASSSTSDNNSSFRGDEDEHVELQAHFSDSQSTGKSSKSNVNSSSMKDKSYLPHYDSLSTVVENVQSEPILFSTTKYHEAEIEGLPSNQLPEIVEFQNTDNRKFVMCDDAHVHEEGVSDSRQTNSELLTSGKMLCSDLEPTKPVTLPAVIQSDESVSDNVELNRLGNGADRSGLVESVASKPSSPSLIKDDTVPVYSSDKISSDNLVDDSLCNDSQEGSLCPSIKELGWNLGDEINGFSSSVDPVEGDGHIENPSYNHVMVNGAITESKDQPIPSVDSAENDAGIITCPASSMICSPSRSLSNPRELVHASSDSYPMESNEVELTQISSDSNTETIESQLAPLPDTTNILYSPMCNLTKLEESVSAFADLNEKETEDHEVVARESLTALEGQKAAGHPELVSSDVQMNLNKLVPCDDLPDLGNNIEKSPPRKKILQSVFQDDAKVVPGFSGFDTRQSESTSYGQNDLIQNDTNSFSSTPDNKLEFETYFEPHLQCQLDEQDGEFPLKYEENFGSEKSQSQQMHINQMKQEGTHATSESVSETPADESPSFCSSPQSSGLEINPTQYVTDPLKPLLPDLFPKETENKLDGMPPMPPLPPMQWRMSKVPHASLDSNREELEVDPSPVQRMQPVMPDTKSQFGFTASDGNTLFHQNPFLPIMALESDKLQHSSAVGVSGHPVALPIQFPIVVNEANGQYGQYNYLVLDVNQIQNPVLTLPVVPASMHPPLGYIVASDGEIVHTSNPYAPILPVVYTASGHDSSSPQVEPFQRPTQVMTESSADDKTQEQPSSEMELKQQGPVVEQIQNVASQDTSNHTLLHKQSQDECLQRQTVPVSHQHSQTNEVQKSEKDPVFNHEVIKTNNPNCESQYAKLQQMSNQRATVNEQPSSQINHSKQVPYGLLLPILIPQLAKDRAMQLTTLFNKLKKDEIPKDHFVWLMKGIVGDQMLRIELTRVQQQTKANAGSSGQQHPVRMPTVTSSGTKFNDPHALAQLHQRSMNPAVDHSHNTSSAIQVKSEPTYSTMDIGAKKSMEHDVRVVQPNQLPSSGSNAVSQETERSSVHIQGLNKQQQQHIHFPSTYGSSGGNYNHFSGTTTGSSSLRPQPHPHDSHIRQIPHQNIGLNHLGVERQSSFTDPKRMPGGSVSTGVNNTAPQQTSTSWQPSAEQNSGLFSSVSYVKKEPNDLSIEQQHRNHLSKLHGLPSVNSGQTEQGGSKAKDNSNSVEEVNAASNGGVTVECGSSENLRHLKKVGAPLVVPFETANGKTSNAGVRTDSPELFMVYAPTTVNDSSKPTPVDNNMESESQRVLSNLPQSELRLLCSLLAHEGLSENAYTLVAEVVQKLVSIAPTHCQLFVTELAEAVQNLISSAMAELHVFGVAMKALLSTTSTDGAAILRVLQALSSLVTSLTTEDHGDRVTPAALSEVWQINSALEPLWHELSCCIRKIESYSESTSELFTPSTSSASQPTGATPPLPAGSQNILPYIESFFVVCEKLHPTQLGVNHDSSIPVISDVENASTSASQQKVSGLGIKVDEKNMAFVRFSEKHRKLLNAFIRQNPGLLEKSFSLMLKVPRFIDFDNKRAHFRSKIKHQHDHHHSPLRISVRRAYVLEDSYNQLRMRPTQDLKGS